MWISRFGLAAVISAFELVTPTATAETITVRVTNAAGQPVTAQILITNVLAAGCSQQNTTEIFAKGDGSFSFDGPPAIYALKARFGGSTVNPAFRKIDTRGGSVSGVAIELRSGRWSYGAGLPPLASRITVGEPDAGDRATIRGTAGAVPPSALVAVVTLESGHYATAIADASGAFETTLFAPRGTHLSVKIDEVGFDWQGIRAGPTQPCFPNFGAMPGTIVPAAPPAPGPGIPFGNQTTVR